MGLLNFLKLRYAIFCDYKLRSRGARDGRESLISCLGDYMGEKGNFALKIQWMRYVVLFSQLEPKFLPPSAFLCFRIAFL